MTIKQNGGIFGRNPTFNNIEADGTITASDDIIANTKVRIEAATNITLEMKDTDGGFAASYLLVENGGRDLSIFAPQDIIFDRDGAETARFRDGGGLCFNGDTAAANALNDYEEGTWTPTLLTGTATAADAVYTKIGNMVYARATLSSFSDRSTASNVVVSSLPYAPAINSSGGSMFSRYTAVATPVPNLTTGGYVTFYGNSSGNYVQLQHSNLSASASASISFNLVYRA